MPCIVFIASNRQEELARGKGPHRVELGLFLNSPPHRPLPRHAHSLPALDQEAGSQEAERKRRPNLREGGRDHERKPWIKKRVEKLSRLELLIGLRYGTPLVGGGLYSVTALRKKRQ